MNQPERYESYVLEPVQTKVTYKKDTKTINSGTFTILKEDHTLGNLVRMELLANENVYFAGYKVPHPLIHEVVLKVRTDGTIEPIQAVINTVDNLLEKLKHVANQYKTSMSK